MPQKPDFDPNQPFEKLDVQKPAFDPTQRFDKAPDSKPVFDPAQKFESGDDAIAHQNMDRFRELKAKVDAQLSPEGVNQIAANALLPQAATAMKGAGLVKRLLTSAGQGAASASVVDPGAPPADRAARILGGAAMGLGTGAVTEAVAPVVSRLGDWASEQMGKLAEQKAFKAAGAMTKDFKQALDQDKMDDLGRYLLDNKIVTAGSTTSKIADRLATAKQAAGEEIGHILDTVDASAAPRISARDIALQLSEDPEIQSLKTIPGREKIGNQIDTYLNTLYNNGDNLSLHAAQKLRQGIDSSINFNKRVPEMAGAQPYLYKMRDALREKMNEAVNAFDQASGSLETNRLAQANRAYNQLADLDRIANSRVAAEAAHRAIGLTDTIAGGAGGTIGAFVGHATGIPGAEKVGAAVGGAVGAGGNKLARTYGSALQAVGAQGASDAFANASSLADFVKQNPAMIPELVTAAGASTQPEVSSPSVLLINRKPTEETAIERRLKSRK